MMKVIKVGGEYLHKNQQVNWICSEIISKIILLLTANCWYVNEI